MKILLISSYPSEIAVNTSAFVYKLVQELIEQGNELVVISPHNWRSKNKKLLEQPGIKSYGEEKARVFRPKYFDFPNRIRAGIFSLGRYNAGAYKKAVLSVLKDLDFKPDAIYGHFLYRSGPAVIALAKHFKVPAVVALGESSLEKHEVIYTKKAMIQLMNQFDGAISVSQKNKNYVVEELNFPANKVQVIPNAVDPNLFYPRDKQAMREKYNLPQDIFLIAFTGHYIERKGPLRVLEALNKVDGNIGGVFIGSGAQNPTGERVLFNKRVPIEQVPELLSAADIFVLPTQNEGSCNAVYEAMACGLPIVSSNIEAIKEQVTKESALLCGPNDVEAIYQAIQKLYDNKEKRELMKKAVLELIADNTIQARAGKIVDFIKSI